MDPKDLLDRVTSLIQLSHEFGADNSAELLQLANQLSSLASILERIVALNLRNDRIDAELTKAWILISSIADLFEKYGSMQEEKLAKWIKWGALGHDDESREIAAELNEPISKLGLLLHVEQIKQTLHPKNVTKNSEIIVAVMGEAGSGKSSFIQRITQSKAVNIGHSLSSEIQTVKSYSVPFGHSTITLVDIPGFDNTSPTNLEVLSKVSSWLAQSYKSQQLLSGIVYLQRMAWDRGSRSKKDSLRLFISLVGLRSFHNILLVTTRWDLSAEESLGRWTDLATHKWFRRKFMIRGSISAHYQGSRKSALAILRRVAFDPRMRSGSVPLKIQEELVDEHRTLRTTSAGVELADQMTEMAGYHREELAHLERVNELTRPQTEEQQKLVRAKINTLKEKLSLIEAQSETFKQDLQPLSPSVVETIISTPISIEELLGDDPPPPVDSRTPSRFEKIFDDDLPPSVESRTSSRFKELLDDDPLPPVESRPPSRFKELLNSLLANIIFGLTPVHELQALIGPRFSRFLRPRLQKDYSRMEWTCSCGDLLYGDYKEGAPGSLQIFAAQLGGQVISGPALQSLANPSNPPAQSQEPPQAHLDGSSSIAASSSSRTSGVSGSSGRQSYSSRDPLVVAGPSTAVTLQQATTSPKWLELCIRSGPDTFVLEEIDISVTQADNVVFSAMRRAYEMNRVAARLFGRFAYRVPNGGVSVQFRKDKLATPREPATASIMARSSMPDSQQAQLYHYVFDPVPMDEPPIDSRTFNHYFHKPHKADPAEKWLRRFPQLHGASLFWNNEALARGWGIEITEDRNWMLFVCANLAALLLSGVIAGVSAYTLKDNATGVAIGAWLTAVQTLITAALFWRWTG